MWRARENDWREREKRIEERERERGGEGEGEGERERSVADENVSLYENHVGCTALIEQSRRFEILRGGWFTDQP